MRLVSGLLSLVSCLWGALVRGVIIGRVRFKFRGTRVHKVVGRGDAELLAPLADGRLCGAPERGKLLVAEPVLLGFPQQLDKVWLEVGSWKLEAFLEP